MFMRSEGSSLQDRSRETPAGSSRRDFLRYGLWVIGGIVSTLVGIPVIGYFISPALKEEASPWVVAAVADQIPVGKPTQIEYLNRRKDGWVTIEERKAAWVVTKDGRNFTVYDPRCTHLGCAYSWKEDRQGFFCPCHNAVFDIDGEVVSGPPPRPLDRLETKIQDEFLYVGRLYRVGEETG
jgi:menaquinol-cytochrome c reductase iron-sulfur subunit